MTHLPRAFAASTVLLFALAACSDDAVQGDEQHQSEPTWRIELVGDGPYPFDVTGNERIAAAFGPDGAMYIAFNDEKRDLVLGHRASKKHGFTFETIKGGDEDT